MYELLKEAMQLEGAASSAFQKLFNALKVELPAAERDELDRAYLGVLEAKREALGEELDAALRDEGDCA